MDYPHTKASFERPFLKMQNLIEHLEMMRRKRELPDDRHYMTLTMVSIVGVEDFIQQASQVHAMREIAQYYWTDLSCAETFDWLLQ